MYFQRKPRTSCWDSKLERFFKSDRKLLVANQERLMDNLSLSAEERFENCIKYTLLQKYLKTDCLYIGVTPEFFSRWSQVATEIVLNNRFAVVISIVLTTKILKSVWVWNKHQIVQKTKNST
jgi:hypothetical protein